MRDPDWFLEPGERVLMETRQHAAAMLAPALWTTVATLGTAAAAVAGFVAGPQQGAIALGVGLSVTALVAIGWLTAWRTQVTSRYVLCPERIYQTRGRLIAHARTTTYEKVTDTSIHQGMLGTVKGYGTVRIQTAGGDLMFSHVPDPLGFRHQVEVARERFLARLLERAPVQAQTRRPGGAGATKAAAAPAQPRKAPGRVDGRVLWQGGPAPAALAGNLVGLGFFVVFLVLPMLLVTFLIHVLVGLSALLVGGAAVAGLCRLLLVGHRRTRYTIRTDGVAVRRGVFTHHEAEAGYGKITDVSLHQDFVGKIFGYGTIVLNTAGGVGAPVHFTSVAEPEQVRQAIDKARRSA